MADRKISQLTDGGTSLTGDEFEVNRGGQSRRVTLPSIATKSTDLSDMPSSLTGKARQKLVVNDAEDGYELVSSTTVQGFDDKTAQTLSFNDGTRELTLTPVLTEYSVTVATGEKFTFNTPQTIQITNTSGLHLIWYDANGVLQSQAGLNAQQIYDTLVPNIAVAVVEWGITDARSNFVTEILKGRDMNNTTWIKNAFDNQIAVLSGHTLSNDPSNGGTVTPSGNDDTSAQFAIGEGYSIWTDGKWQSLSRAVGADWNVYYKTSSDLRHLLKTAFPVLTDIDVGVGATGRLVRADGATPVVVTSGDFVWYFVGISNDITTPKRLVSFMGINEYGTLGAAQASLQDEVASVERAFAIRQEFAVIYGAIYETSNSYANAVKARIRDLQIIQSEAQGGSVSSFPPELVDGSDASGLHNHNSLYANLTGNNATVFENTKTETFASIIELDFSERSSFEIEITGNTTIQAINHSKGQFPDIKYTVNTVTPPTIILDPTDFEPFDENTDLPNANGDYCQIIGASDGTKIKWDARTKIA